MIKNLVFGVYLLISDFLVESLKANKNYQKYHSFYNTVQLKKPHSFYEPQLTQHCKKYSPVTQVKTSFWLLSEKTIGSVAKQMFVYSCKSPFQNVSSRDVGSFWGMWWGMNNFLQADDCYSLNVLKIFVLIEVFGNSTFFQHSDTSINSIKTLKFARQFGLPG